MPEIADLHFFASRRKKEVRTMQTEGEQMLLIRYPAVAGTFYPADPTELHQCVRAYLDQAQIVGTPAKAIIAPHAGFVYSGPIAASAYSQWQNLHDQITRVVLLGPSHRVPLQGIATSSASHYATPLGSIALDRSSIDSIMTLAQVQNLDDAHTFEHSLEVQLPFLQEILDKFVLVPLVVGEAEYWQVSEVIDLLWGGPETVIVISSDLSHFQPYSVAQRRDLATSLAIESFDYTHINGDDACGKNPLNGFLHSAKRRGMSVTRLDLRNSADTAGTKDSVVGYGAYAFTEPHSHV